MKYEPRSNHTLSDIEILMMPMLDRTAEDYEPNWDLLDAVDEALSTLTESEQEILRIIFFDRETYENLKDSIGLKAKSHAWRKTQAALANLESALRKNHKFIRSFKMTTTTWEQGAKEALRSLFVRTNDHLPSSVNYYKAESRISDVISDLKFVGGKDAQTALFNATQLAGTEALCHLMKDKDESVINDSLLDILIRKQHDYGHDNINRFGLVGVAIRLCDKIARMYNLLESDNPAKNEPLLDTYVDIVGYAAIAYMLETGTFQLELVGDAQ